MKSNHLIYSLILQFIFFCSINITAQSQEIDFQTWSDLTVNFNIKNKAIIGADLGIRGLVSKNQWNQFYFRPTYKYYFNSTMQAAGGVAIFATISDVLKNTYEFRIFQEASVAWPSFEIINFHHRVRFEERFFTYRGTTTFGADVPDDFEARARYQLSFETIDIQLGNRNRPIYFLAGWELFYALNKTAIEQFINNQRLLGGVGHRISPRFKYEIQYIFQKSRRFIDEGLQTTEHLLRIRLFLLPKAPKRAEG